MHTALRRAVAAATVIAFALLVPTAAHAITPKQGYYEGEHVFFKIEKFSARPQLFRLSTSETMTCADGTTRADTMDTIIILGPKVRKSGRFKYEGTGVTFKGRFTSRTQAHGTLTRSEAGCTASLSWTASLKTGGVSVPTG
jgi:hypothetical protein